MNTQLVTRSARDLGRMLSRNSPTILTAFSVAGMITTVLMAVKTTPRAIQLLEEDRELILKETGEEPTKLDILKVIWKPYLPTVLMGSATIFCMISVNHIHLRRNAALLSLYSLAEKTLQEYQTKVVETIGRHKDDHIRADLAQEEIDRNPVSEKTIIITGKGDHLFFDGISGRYFRSDIEKMRKIQNDLNRDLLVNMYITLNDLYFEMGLEGIMLGGEIGWEVNNMLEFRFDSKITKEGEPCIVLGYIVRPTTLK